MIFEILLDGSFDTTVILQPKEYQVFDFSMKRKIHNEMLEYYSARNWNRVITHCMELTGEFDGALDHYYAAMRGRVFKLKLQDHLLET